MYRIVALISVRKEDIGKNNKFWHFDKQEKQIEAFRHYFSFFADYFSRTTKHESCFSELWSQIYCLLEYHLKFGKPIFETFLVF